MDELIERGDPLRGTPGTVPPRPPAFGGQTDAQGRGAAVDRSATALLGSAARVTLLRALIRDASGGVRRPHAATALVAGTGVSPGRTREALRCFAACGLVEWRRGPGRSRRVRLCDGPLIGAWLGPFFAAEAALLGPENGPLLPGRIGVAAARSEDVDGVKRLADLHRRTIGFVVRAALEESLRLEALWVARGEPDCGGAARVDDNGPPSAVTGGAAIIVGGDEGARMASGGEAPVVGFVQVHRRRDGQTTLHLIAVDPARRGEAIGTALLDAAFADSRARGMRGILLRCPQELPANRFYEQQGFRLRGVEPGKRRPLCVWWRDC